jgi:hypothetical protein
MYGSHICNEYTIGLDAFIDFVMKDIWAILRGIFVVHANIARMRKNIVQMMC